MRPYAPYRMIGASCRARYLVYFAPPRRHKENGMRKAVEYNGYMTLEDLNDAIQAVMGWCVPVAVLGQEV